MKIIFDTKKLRWNRPGDWLFLLLLLVVLCLYVYDLTTAWSFAAPLVVGWLVNLVLLVHGRET